MRPPLGNDIMAVIQGWLLFRGLVTMEVYVHVAKFILDQSFWPLYAYGCCSGVAVKRGSTVVKVEEGSIQGRVCSCPPRLPAGFYWYGGRRKSPGRLPPWLAKLLSNQTEESEASSEQRESFDDDIESEQVDLEPSSSDE